MTPGQGKPKTVMRIPWRELERDNPLDVLEIFYDHMTRAIDGLLQYEQNDQRTLVWNRESRASDTAITLKTYGQNREKVKTIIFQCSSSATLTLGAFVLTTLPAGLYIWPNLDFIRDITDVFSLVQASAGQIAFAYSGRSLGDAGILP